MPVELQREAANVFAKLDLACASSYSDPTVAGYVAAEVRRIVAAIDADPSDPALQRHRIIQADGAIDFVVDIRTPTGVPHDAAVFWTLRLSDDVPVVLTIELQYLR
jgi:hypothetical protein